MDEPDNNAGRPWRYLRGARAILLFIVTFLSVSFLLDAVRGRNWEVDPYAVLAGIVGVVAALLLKQR